MTRFYPQTWHPTHQVGSCVVASAFVVEGRTPQNVQVHDAALVRTCLLHTSLLVDLDNVFTVVSSHGPLEQVPHDFLDLARLRYDVRIIARYPKVCLYPTPVWL